MLAAANDLPSVMRRNDRPADLRFGTVGAIREADDSGGEFSSPRTRSGGVPLSAVVSGPGGAARILHRFAKIRGRERKSQPLPRNYFLGLHLSDSGAHGAGAKTTEL